MALTLEQLRDAAPAIFTEQPAATVSKKYFPVSTLQIVETLSQDGWVPVSAEQRHSRLLKHRPYAKHLLRFQHTAAHGVFPGAATVPGQAYPELVVSNSHNGTSPYQLYAGFHVVACLNGLIVADDVIGSIKVPHLVAYQQQLRIAAETIRSMLVLVTDQVLAMRARILTDREREQFAHAALQSKFPANNAPFTVPQVLLPRRESDKSHDLWTVFNVIQENLMAGGTSGTTQSGRRYTSRPVRDVNQILTRNQAFWSMAVGILKGSHV